MPWMGRGVQESHSHLNKMALLVIPQILSNVGYPTTSWLGAQSGRNRFGFHHHLISTPCNYFLWGYWERKVTRSCHPNIDSLEASIMENMTSFDKDMVKKACSWFSTRLIAVVEAEGSPIVLYRNSTKNRYWSDYFKHCWRHSCCWSIVIEVVAGDAGNTGINSRRCCDGLMVHGIFISDGRSWCHVFQTWETVNSCGFIAVMQQFFTCLRAADTEENRY